MTKPRKFEPGFRLSTLDVVVLVLGGGAGAYAATLDRWFGIAIGFVVLHFFLFCNVLRMSRPLELIWAVVFLGLAVGVVTLEALTWPWVFGVSLFVTAIVTVIEIRRPSYHGQSRSSGVVADERQETVRSEHHDINPTFGGNGKAPLDRIALDDRQRSEVINNAARLAP